MSRFCVSGPGSDSAGLSGQDGFGAGRPAVPRERLHHPDAPRLPVRGPRRARPGRERARESQAAGGAAAGRGTSAAGESAGPQDQREDGGQRRSSRVSQQAQQSAQHGRAVRRRVQPLQRIAVLL